MEPESEDKLSSLEKARERLYEPEALPPLSTRPLSPQQASGLPHAWSVRQPVATFGLPHHMRFATRFFIGTLVFFVLAIAIAGFLFFSGKNAVSVENVGITVKGPTSLGSGDPIPLSISITNKNGVAISNVSLEVDFPEGSRSADDVTKAYPRSITTIGTLPSGKTSEQSVKAILFGGQGTQLALPISVTYEAEGSSAVFVKRTTYLVTVSSAPLSVAINTVSETVSGKSFTIEATVNSNAATAVSGVVLSAQYPAGYTLTTSSIANVGTNFPLGTLKPGESKKVTLTGVLTGQNSEERVFHFTVGTAKSANDPTLAVRYMTQDASVVIAAPFLSTTMTVNGSSVETPVVAPGSTVNVTVSWINTLSSSIQNADIEVTLSGGALDANSIQTGNGFYRSSDHTVVFNRDTDRSLASFPAGASGTGSFTFTTLPSAATRGASIVLTLSIAGQRIGEVGVPQTVSATSQKTIKIASAVTLVASSLHYSGPFVNIGPMPPKADEPTTYTVVWKTGSSGNDIADARVVAVLPSYITFMGLTSPADGSITYDLSTRMITWRVGDIPAGSTRQGSFQISITPSTSQRGTTPTLTSAPTFSGFDRFAQAQVSLTGNPATTDTKGEPGYIPANAAVQ